jgi:hypothetical protein
MFEGRRSILRIVRHAEQSFSARGATSARWRSADGVESSVTMRLHPVMAARQVGNVYFARLVTDNTYNG